jgi:hypothetical protein
LGFQVTELVDADYNAMRQAVINFGRTLRFGSDASLFYYSGHGIQVGGHNYLVPIDAALKDEQEAGVETFDVESYLSVMQDSGSRVNIVVLDACRNNPFATVFRGAPRGLSMVRAPAGTFIGYSTAPGDVADDGDGANSPFTLALVDAISQQGVEIEEVFKKVRRKVMEETKGRQVPWDSNSITEDFYFVPSHDAMPRIPSGTLVPATAVPKVDDWQAPRQPVDESQAPTLAGATVASGILNAPWAPWGVQVAGDFSLDRALASFIAIEREFPEFLTGPPLIVRKLNRSRNWAPLYQILIPAADQRAANDICRRLESTDGACMVFKN